MPSPALDPEVARLASGLLEGVEMSAADLTVHIVKEIDVYGPKGIVPTPELESAVEANLRYLLSQLTGRPDPDAQTPATFGQIRATQDVPLHDVLRAYRIGFGYIWERLLEAARTKGGDALHALLDASTKVWSLSDEFSLAVTEAYHSTLSERMVATDRRRSGVVSAILDGPATHSAWEVAKLLDLPYEGAFLVLVAEAPPGRAAPLPGFEERLRRLEVVSVWRSQPDHEIGVLSLGLRRDPDSVIAAMNDTATARVGVSPTFVRLDGAARGLRLAKVAMDSLPSGAKEARQMEDDARVDLLVRDWETTRRFVVRVLGKVLTLPDDDRSTLLATATAWIDAKGSSSDASRVLFCHENTVRYRIRRLEEHLGGALAEPRQLSDVIMALEAIQAFPDLGRRLP